MRGFLHILLAMIAGAAVGWISALGMIENFGLRSVLGNPQWQERRAAPGEPFSPYSTGYFVELGRVPPPASARFFVRTTDDDGSIIRGECTYVVSGAPVPARWWTIALGNDQGRFNAIGAADVILEANGELRLFLAPYPVSGSRILSPPGNALTLTYVVHEPDDPDAIPVLPSVRKVGC